MTLHRFQNTEKRIQKSPEFALAYKKIIDAYIAKGYDRKVPKS